ncbi:MAG: hypothetical protein DI537_02570 [Stutzerimonas stutzeri]|nr:MAG: hypothetical protein DI537_02570 [Stutzerimonas stutzeri]
MRSFPKFDELPRDERGVPFARGVWGENDQIGMLNNIDSAATARGAELVRSGRRFNLNLPLHLPLGGFGCGAHKRRKAPSQTLIKDDHSGLLIRDEKIDDFYTQGSTQWDGLTHVGDPAYGFYNGVSDAEVTQREGTRNGIEHYVRFGIATRGVVVNLPVLFAAQGREWSPLGRYEVSAAELEQCLTQAGVTLEPGDVLLIRTGWLEHFLNQPQEGRERVFRERDHSGLAGDLAMWRFLWDNRVAAIACDNPAVEILPFVEGRPSLHLGIARLGLVLGELFDLEELAAESAETGRATCMFASMPLNLRGGVGSPANAMALR